ncbi:hypothetical protein LEP1GSC060_2704 [Leptospira weilii serovar Ranarum str. ICFT]|uniref:Uncharacterized protein n=1 Tax=Leptospira weilii serovar Ranarum str. ICFT TaxID=1218598 RepID=N1WG79_9LEPT|nr:hypothetical protein LEP1GSC060_2704 [Leptospira weilii serovar Ranarum str. ICFT]
MFSDWWKAFFKKPSTCFFTFKSQHIHIFIIFLSTLLNSLYGVS